MKNYEIKTVEVDYRYWFAQQILFSLVDTCPFDNYLSEEFKRLAIYCDEFCGIPEEFEGCDLLYTKAYYNFKVKSAQTPIQIQDPKE